MSYRAQHKYPHGVYILGEWDGEVQPDGTTPAISQYVKIGIARDVKSRIAQLQTANPRALILLDWREYPTRDAARAVERAVHAELAPGRKCGEWFEVSIEQATLCVDFVSP